VGRYRRRREEYGDEEEGLVNLTPLIDVVFVVLITFILVAPLVEVETVQLATGREQALGPIPLGSNKGLVVHVYQDNTIWINQVQISPHKLGYFFGEYVKRTPNRRLQVFHDRGASFGTYQELKNAAENAGFEAMDLVLNPV
jgi:biopolymer transport protein ExbD